MVSPSPTPSPRTGPLTAAPPALLIPVDTDELDKEHDSFPDISTRQSFSSNTLAAKHHRRKTTLHLAPSSAAVTYQLSPLPLQSAAVQSERQTFLAHAALRSTFIKQGSMQRLSTLRGGVGSALLSTFYRPPLPITVRQETRSRLGSHTRQSTVSFAPAVATTLLEKINSNEQCGSREATKHRLPSYVPIVQVADSFVYRGEAEENERCQHGYEVMPVLSMLLEHQVSDLGATDGRACLHVVVKAPQQQQESSNKRLLFYTKAPSEDDMQLLDSQSLASIESSLLAQFTPAEPIAESDTDDENDGEFFYTEAQDANESSDDDDSDNDDAQSTTKKSSKRNSPHTSQPSSKRSSTTQPTTTTSTTTTTQPAILPPIPIHRPTCCICTSVDLIDPWLSACAHLCCGECWVAWLMEQSESGDTLVGGACPECGKGIDLEVLKRVVMCERCASVCVSGAGQHWTNTECRHTCCLQCWRGQLASKQTCPVCDVPVDAALFPVE